MPTPICPKCRQEIPGEDINVPEDVAWCRDCNISYNLSDLTKTKDASAGVNAVSSRVVVNLQQPPAGTWYASNGAGTVIGATNRSLGMAGGLLFFTLFWDGIVSVFVAIVLTGTLRHLNVSLPAWVPDFNLGSSGTGLGMLIFLWLFLTPFMAIGLFIPLQMLMCLIGHTEVRIESSRGVVFTGVGPIGWKRQFDAYQVKDVRLYETQKRDNRTNDTYGILVETREGRQIKLGSMLTGERRQFVLGALQSALMR